jgi:hemerythrin-like domain-containing protein
MGATDLSGFAQQMSAHIRKEERQLFERLQGLMTAEQLTTMGRKLEDALQDAAQACSLPTEATKLRSAK